MKTLCIPLDERPCNRLFPAMIGKSNETMELLLPEEAILGNKKTPADTEGIIQFLLKHVNDVDNIILSLDMLLYGGLIPSRIHHLFEETVIQRLQVLRQLKQINPKIKIYAFQCIMRSPSYDSGEEEPAYYEQYGKALFQRKYLLDYQQRHGLDSKQEKELNEIVIPEEIIKDYEERRDFNLRMNLESLSYVISKDIDFLVIPQDDSSPYGYTAIAQKKVTQMIKDKHLDMQVMVYPGADEVAMSLMARAYHEYMHMTPKVYPFYSSILGPTIIPNYEDRPMFESLKSHVRVCRAKLVETPQEADFILAINAPGKFMQEAFINQDELDVSYTSYRNLLDFAYRIQEFCEEGYSVAICDSAFSNGGDLPLIQYLDQLNILDQIIAYAGWNTNCNSLGTTLCQMFVGTNGSMEHLCYRIIEDVFYQSIVRKQVVENFLPKLGLSYYDMKDAQLDVENEIKENLQELYNALSLSKKYPYEIESVFLPWKRMFEIGMKLHLQKS